MLSRRTLIRQRALSAYLRIEHELEAERQGLADTPAQAPETAPLGSDALPSAGGMPTADPTPAETAAGRPPAHAAPAS